MQDTTNVVVAVYEVRVLVLVVVSQYSKNFPSLKMENIDHKSGTVKFLSLQESDNVLSTRSCFLIGNG